MLARYCTRAARSVANAATGAAPATAAELSQKPAVPAIDRKVYELRTYSAHPDKFPAFLALCSEHMEKRFAYSKCLGYWTTELGGANQTVHIWEYDSYDHRTQVRKALAGDSVWMNEFMAKMRPMLQSQTNMTMKKLGFYPVTAPDHAALGAKPMEGFYELRLETMRPTNDAHWRWSAEMQVGLSRQEVAGWARPLGLWFSDVGAGRTGVQLWYWPTLNAREDARAAAATRPGFNETYLEHRTYPFLRSVESKVLQPTAFSPWK